MDRFIAPEMINAAVDFLHLKSNMDRFIVEPIQSVQEAFLRFKIQYG